MNQPSRHTRPITRHAAPRVGMSGPPMNHHPQQPGSWHAPNPNHTLPPPPGYPTAGPASGIPVGPPRHAQPAAVSQALNLAMVKGIGVTPSLTAGLLFGGWLFAAIAIFLPWMTVSVDSPLAGDLYKVDASPFQGGWVFPVLLVIAAAAVLAWPTVTRSRMPMKRLAGLTALVGVQITFLLIGLLGFVDGVSEKQRATAQAGEELNSLHISVGFGLLLYASAVVAIVVGLVRTWIQWSQAKNQTS
jgi:hypothetical protein